MSKSRLCLCVVASLLLLVILWPPRADSQQVSGPASQPATQPAGGGKPISIKDWAGFQKTVLQADRPVLVLLAKDPCPTCVIQQEEVDKLAKEFAGRIVFARMVIMTDFFKVTCPEVRDAYKVSWVPTTMLFIKGQERKRWELNHTADEIREELKKVAGDSNPPNPSASGPEAKDY